MGQVKRPTTQDSRLGGHQGQGRCAKCRRTHDGGCRDTGRGCFSCGHMGHFSRDCPYGPDPMCFHYNQVDHKKADCLMFRGKVSAPAPVTLRITDVCDGRKGAPTARS